MEDVANILVRSIFIDNLFIAYFLGLCSYMAVSKSVKVAVGLGLTVTFTLGISASVCHLLGQYLLGRGTLTWLSKDLEGIDLTPLSLIFFWAVVILVVKVAEMLQERYLPALHALLKKFVPLTAVSCAILGGTLFMQEQALQTLPEVAALGFGSGLGWLLTVVSLAAIRERITYSDIPKPLQGLGITFIVAGLMGIAFLFFIKIRL
ncbi:MAG: NADH:ubiquinone reductase (Na(+)-transporting) subunit E [Prevotellaceae bacterium]|jgi:Na+-transporting NADH:ubiquinone oxidoreductase subunit E|nr:NADH:ubiquinone reductase (Na(+)-transporting) subunit E [Prevotellaceae bacterium]